MKKITFLFLSLFFSIGTFAQFHVTSNKGDIEDGSTFTFGTTEEDEAKIIFDVHNDGDEPIFMRMKVASIENADGSSTEFCFGSCMYFITEGLTNPTQGPYPVIEPGETQLSNEDHFWNFNENPIDATEPITYTISFEEVNGSGSEVINSITFTYTYDSDLSVEGNEKDFGMEIQNTMIRNGEINIKAQESGAIQIFNLLGQEVKAAKLTTGMNTLDIADLSSQVYLVRFQNQSGAIKTQKIVVE